MYKFIKILPNINPLLSIGAYLYQDISTKKYYLSYTHPNSEDIIDNSKQYMLLNNKPVVTRQELLKNISKESEVTQNDFIAKKIGNYKL
jgi:hypothetical protein